MKNLSITVAVTALIAFSLGYFTRGAVERTPKIPKDTEQFTVLEDAKDPAPQSIVRAELNDESVQTKVGLDHEAISSTIDAAHRESRAKRRRSTLEDFFLTNGIGSDRAEQIVQGLVEADYYLEQIQQTMFDRRTAEKAELIARGDEVGISLTPEDRADYQAEAEAPYREVFGEFYEAYKIYNRSHVQRRVVGTFSSSLAEPLDYVAKETLVQIMYEEQSRLETKLASESAGPGAQPTSALQGWEAEKDKYNRRILELRHFNESVLNRTRPYLTASQFDKLKVLLQEEIRRFELLIELADLDE